MQKFLAFCFLTLLGILNMLGLYWWGFGLWPINWWAFVVFTLVNILLFAIRMGMEEK